METWKTARSGAPKEMKPNPSREVESKFLTVPSKFLFLSWLLGSFISAFLCVSFLPPTLKFDESFHWGCLSSVIKLTEFLWRVFYLWQNEVWPG